MVLLFCYCCRGGSGSGGGTALERSQLPKVTFSQLLQLGITSYCQAPEKVPPLQHLGVSRQSGAGPSGRSQAHFSFLSPRRNRPGDREKALAVLLPLVQCEGPVAPDLYCMCGRIYKDMFFSSGFQDAEYREQAYHW